MIGNRPITQGRHGSAHHRFRRRLRGLRTLAYVDGAHVGVMGGSHGGTTTLLVDSTAVSGTAPLAAERAQAAGYPMTLKIYPGALHRRPRQHQQADGRGATTGGDPAAWADSIIEVKAFFARYLKA